MNAYLDLVQEVMDYLRVTQRNADSYHASVSGKMGHWMERAVQVQSDIVSAKSVTSEFLVGQALLDKTKAKNGPVAAQIAADKPPESGWQFGHCWPLNEILSAMVGMPYPRCMTTLATIAELRYPSVRRL